MIPEIVTGAAVASCAGLAYAVRAPSSSLLCPSFWHGPRDRKAIALTFDDGPSENTPELLDLLETHGAKATFFACGQHVERLPKVACSILSRGHEIGNHTYSHAPLYLRPAQFIADELFLAQEAIYNVTGQAPSLFRPTYGARWFGLRRALEHFQMKNVMWTTIGLDWKLNANQIYARLKAGTKNGAIICLHDGRELAIRPDIRPTMEAVQRTLPELRDLGYELVTVSNLLCLKTSLPASSK